MKIEELIEILNMLKEKGIEYVFIDEICLFNNIEIEMGFYLFDKCVILSSKK